MKRQDISKLHHETIKDLNEKILTLQKSLVETRMQIMLGKEKNLKKTNNIRKDIARIKTIIKNQELKASVKTK